MYETPSEERLLEFLYACPVGLIECSALGDISLVNAHAMQHLFPIAGGANVDNLFDVIEQYAPEIRNLVAAFPKPSGRICDNHRIVIDLAGGQRSRAPRVLACTLVKLAADRFIVTLSDISQQVAHERRLQQADAWFASLLDRINDYSVVTITPNGEIVSADEAFCVQLGLLDDDVEGRHLGELLAGSHQEDGLRLTDQIGLAGRDGWHLHEGWQRRANGDRYWCQRLVVSRCRKVGEPPFSFLVVLRDVPRPETNSDDLYRLLTQDHLTGAANRMHFSQSLERERLRWETTKQPLSLIVLDLDHFKAVNDTHGHPVGDALLKVVSENCQSHLPPQALFARLGGEEFAVLLPECDGDAAARHAELLREMVGRLKVPVEDRSLKITASLAYATLAEVDGSIDRLMTLADRRLYDAKRAGRNRVFHPELVVT